MFLNIKAKVKLLCEGFEEYIRTFYPPTPRVFTSGYANAAKTFSIAFVKLS